MNIFDFKNQVEPLFGDKMTIKQLLKFGKCPLCYGSIRYLCEDTYNCKKCSARLNQEHVKGAIKSYIRVNIG